jgi:hypothetical protein
MQKVLNKVNLITYLVCIVAIITILRFGKDVVKWARHKDYLSAGCFKRFSHRSRNNKPPIDAMTHENPHTQSPRMAKKGVNGGPSSVFSATETCEFVFCLS